MDGKISKFYEEIFKDFEISEKIKGKMKKIKSEGDLRKLIEEEIVPLAQKNGENFTVDDLINFEKENINKISIEDLANINGGVSLKPMILSGGLLVLSLLGLKMNTADATVPIEIVANFDVEKAISTNKAQDANTSKTPKGATPGANTNESSTDTPVKMKKEYIITTLNPKEAEIWDLSGTTERLRFCNGLTENVATGAPGGDGVPALDFKKYAGEGIASLMTSVFPSSGGQLSTNGGLNRYASLSLLIKDLAPSPDSTIQFMAGMLTFCHYARSPEFDEKKVMGYISKLTEEKRTGKPADLPEEFSFLRDVVNCDFSGCENKESKRTRTNQWVRHVKSVLKNIIYAIQHQEQGSPDSDGVLPQYTVERALMSFCNHIFNSLDDFDSLFTRLARNVDSNTEVSAAAKARDKMLKKVLSKITSATNCPYKNKLAANGDTKIITKNNENGLQFTSGIFQDCADTAARHLLNLMGYNDTTNWDFFLAGTDEEKLGKDSNDIITAIKKNGPLPNLPQKDRIQAFFYHQKTHGPDDTSIETRSFWNAAISFMNEWPNKQDLFDINYRTNGTNEIISGSVNMLKAMYNLLYTLGKDCAEAKTAIDSIKLEEKNQDQLLDAFTAVLKVFDKDVQVEVKGKSLFEKGEIYGDIVAKSNGKEFTIHQKIDHAAIDFEPIKTLDLSKDEQGFVASDQTAQLLSKFWKIDVEPENLTLFNAWYGDLNPDLAPEQEDSESNISKHYANFKTLKFLKNIQGEGNNDNWINMEINPLYKKSNIIVEAVTKIPTPKLPVPKFIFENYAHSCSVVKKFLSATDLSKDGECYKFAKENGYLGTDESNQSEFFCWPKGEGVKVMPFINSHETSLKISIPAEVTINGQAKKVTGLVSDFLCVLKDEEELELSCEDLEELTIECPEMPKNLKCIRILGNVKTLNVEKLAFWNCKNLEEFVLPESVETFNVGENAFRDCEKLEEFVIPENVKEFNVEDNAFLCSGVKKVTLPEGLKAFNIGKFAFSCLKEMEKFTLPESLEILNVAGYAFYGCVKLKEVVVPGGVKVFGTGVGSFDISGVETVTVSEGVESVTIGESTFSSSNLKEFVLPMSVKTCNFEKGSFEYCFLGEVTIPYSIESLNIESEAFDKPINLKILVNDGKNLEREKLKAIIDKFKAAKARLKTVTLVGNNMENFDTSGYKVTISVYDKDKKVETTDNNMGILQRSWSYVKNFFGF